jgi:hypothetical protein
MNVLSGFHNILFSRRGANGYGYEKEFRFGREDKWRLTDELWSDLAQQVEGEAPNENIVELLEKRFSDYLVDPSQGQPADDAFARLAEHKRQWK